MTARFRLPAAAALLALLTLPTHALAQRGGESASKGNLPGEGSELYRYLLDLAGVRPVTQQEGFRLNRGNSSDVILVVIGKTQKDVFVCGKEADTWLDEIPRGGGSVLFLSESGQQFFQPPNARERQFVTLNGARVVAPQTVPRYANRPECPFVVPVVRSDEQLTPLPLPDALGGLFRDLDRVTTNGPGYFFTDLPGPEYRFRLARLPHGCTLQFDPQPLPRNAMFALGGEENHPDTGKPFRYVAMADQDVFTNRLLVAPDTHNLELAKRTVVYLADPPTSSNPFGASRKRCLFIEHGRHLTDFKAAEYIFAPPTPVPPVPPLGKIQDKIIDAGNQMIDRLQTNDGLNRGYFGDDPDRRARKLRELVALLLGVAAVYAVLHLLMRVWRSRQPLDVPNPPQPGKPGGTDPAAPAGIFDRRQRELTRRDDVSEPIRAAVREMFTAAGAPADAGAKLPKVRIADTVRRPETLRKALGELWAIGYGPPRRLTVRRWETLEPLFLRARRAYTDGKWSFVTSWDYGADDPQPRTTDTTPRRS
jgi:hypothetical protein